MSKEHEYTIARPFSTHRQQNITILLLFVFVLNNRHRGSAGALWFANWHRVSGSSGAALGGAKVEALNIGTGVSLQVSTDPSGIYHFSTLQAGVYRVTVSSANFATAQAENCPGGRERRVDVVLKVAAQQQTVEVTAEQALLQTDRADVHTDLNAAKVQSLPAISSEGKSFQALCKIISRREPAV